MLANAKGEKKPKKPKKLRVKKERRGVKLEQDGESETRERERERLNKKGVDNGRKKNRQRSIRANYIRSS